MKYRDVRRVVRLSVPIPVVVVGNTLLDALQWKGLWTAGFYCRRKIIARAISCKKYFAGEAFFFFCFGELNRFHEDNSLRICRDTLRVPLIANKTKLTSDEFKRLVTSTFDRRQRLLPELPHYLHMREYLSDAVNKKYRRTFQSTPLIEIRTFVYFWTQWSISWKISYSTRDRRFICEFNG